jgi:CO dehydrogenase/acetyl-CoA synthase epsilon subunit
MGKTVRRNIQQVVSAGKKTPEAVNKAIEKAKDPEVGEEAIKPENLPALLVEDIRKRKMQIDEEREYFIERGINPYREAFEILLSFFNKFDTVAGMKAKT